MSMEQAFNTFLSESRELLEEMEQSALHVETQPDDAEAVNALFRAAHTIKGSAGLFGLDPVVDFTHVVESVLDKVRDGEVRIDEALVATLLSCVDHMSTLIDQADMAGMTVDEQVAARGKVLEGQLGAYLDGDGAATASAAADSGPAEVVRVERPDVETRNWHISLRFGPDVLRNGMDPLSFLRYLRGMGEIVNLVTLADGMPAAENMDPESCYLGFEINFASESSKEQIEDVFEFVRDDCELRIIPPASNLQSYIRHIHELPEEALRLGELLVRVGTLTERELEAALQKQAEEQHRRPVGEILVEQGVVDGQVLGAALEKQKEQRERRNKEGGTVRVDAEKLDHLINLIGELVISGAGTSLLARAAGNGELMESSEVMSRLIEEIRESALRLRMVQIGDTFTRFRRVVRDVSHELGKDIDLVVSGGDTELDKAVVEKISDPLLHLVRNAMDHGIESVEVRRERGKPEKGTLSLNAYHDSGNVVIEVGDDGGGLHLDRIRAKAIERGLLTAEQQLSERETFNLIFEPGFSTAAAVTGLSGRGVGMDVVRRNIEALRGTIDLSSRAGEGTTVRISLPLTLAIIDGFHVRVAEASYVLPLDAVVECVELPTVSGRDRDYINLRGEVLPFLRLREFFAHGERRAGDRENVVVVQSGGRKAGLVVDGLMGELQTVIKPLGRIFQHLKGISGSTVLGSGEVALIVDIHSLVELAVRKEGQGIPHARTASGAPAIPQLH